MTEKLDRTIALHDDVGIDVTAVMALKHADLWAAATSVGGCGKLAKHLGVSATELSAWINLRRVPPPGPSSVRGKWTEQFWYGVEAKLFVLTGKTMDELFPAALRYNITFLKSRKAIERTVRLSETAMLHYAESTNRRLSALNTQADEKKKARDDAIQSAMVKLTDREREIISMRFGLDGEEPKILSEIASVYKVGRERIRQIEAKAISKMRMDDELVEDVFDM